MDAVAQIEGVLGARLPDDYVVFLRTHMAEDQVGMYVASNPDYWGVRMLFDASTEPQYSSVTEVLRLVGDVIPANSVPVAEDWSGNMYLLMYVGPNRGQVVWWNHEREIGDFSVDHVARSFSEFKGLLRYEAP
jgi:SMI1 / KNR4 family (SUKH-1)